MIQGNYNNKIAYAHTKVIYAYLGCQCNWPMILSCNRADDLEVEIIKSEEDMGYWYYWVWAPTPNGNKMLMKLPERHLFKTAIEASLDHLKHKEHAQLMRYACCYHKTKPSILQRIKTFLAKKTPGGHTITSVCDDRNGRGLSHSAPSMWRFL